MKIWNKVNAMLTHCRARSISTPLKFKITYNFTSTAMAYRRRHEVLLIGKIWLSQAQLEALYLQQICRLGNLALCKALYKLLKRIPVKSGKLLVLCVSPKPIFQFLLLGPLHPLQEARRPGSCRQSLENSPSARRRMKMVSIIYSHLQLNASLLGSGSKFSAALN